MLKQWQFHFPRWVPFTFYFIYSFTYFFIFASFLWLGLRVLCWVKVARVAPPTCPSEQGLSAVPVEPCGSWGSVTNSLSYVEGCASHTHFGESFYHKSAVFNMFYLIAHKLIIKILWHTKKYICCWSEKAMDIVLIHSHRTATAVSAVVTGLSNNPRERGGRPRPNSPALHVLQVLTVRQLKAAVVSDCRTLSNAFPASAEGTAGCPPISHFVGRVLGCPCLPGICPTWTLFCFCHIWGSLRVLHHRRFKVP